MVADSRTLLLRSLVRMVICSIGMMAAGAQAHEIIARGDVRAVDRVLAGTGLRVDMLLRRHAQGQNRQAEQGGPFIPDAPPGPDRWDRLQRALLVLPLAAPLTEYEVTSGYGRRRDPLNRRRAMHAGIDLRAPPRAAVATTAPGRVVFAGRRGGYGRMVEIDHGLGVHTRYAHLAVISVRPGQSVHLGSRIGQVGSTGRSTGPHLHYEVLVDGKARDPQPFLKAGQRLSGSALPSTDRLHRDSRASPNSRGCPCP